MISALRTVVRHLGLPPSRRAPETPCALPVDLSDDERGILRRIGPFTMTSIERQVALIQAVDYISRRCVPGALVECGVWRGGSSMAAALALLRLGDARRELWLYDTFEGMPPPTSVDRTTDGVTAAVHLERDPNRSGHVWAVAAIDEVRANLGSTGYPRERLRLIQGRVEDTIPASIPDGPIALLRLDTDWYESTRHELAHLFPRLAEGGVLIIDDYGHWEGARRAVDEFLSVQPRHFMLHRIDYTGRLLIKL